jgi:hypothetical protein
MSEKSCNCAEGPKITQAIPSGFTGKVRCERCEGFAQYPRSEKKYEGKDPVEGYLFDIKRNFSEMTFETAVVTMLLRIERALLQRGGGNGNVHR